MPALDVQFAGSIPDLYDRILGPIIFQPFADDLARRAAAFKPQTVLEIAAGTGIVTRALLKALPETSSLIATDLNQPMLDHAARNTASGCVDWRQADAAALPFGDAAFDTVVCQFGVMFFPDKLAAYKEAFRVLTPGGKFLFNVWGPLKTSDFANTVTVALAKLFPDNPPQFFARTPHGYHDIAAIKEVLVAASFSNVNVETVELESVAASAMQTAIGFCQGTPLRSEIEVRDPSGPGRATEVAATALARKFGTSRIHGRMQAHIFQASR